MLSACASSSNEVKPLSDGSTGSANTKRFDINKDGTPDIFEYGRQEADEEGHMQWLVERRELDVNRDGKVDVWRFYLATPAKQGAINEEHFDLDFDGRVDMKSYFTEGQLARQELDQNFDGAPDTIRFYERGKLARKEIDRRFVGKADYFEFFENGTLDRIGIDRDGDGQPDTWQQKKEE